ncbi:glucose-6-phosphate isomerase [bacterium]|nr:glucose-6-phosphate isomerase [bacterium]
MSESRLKLDVTRMMADAIGKGYGVSSGEIEQIWPRVMNLLQGLEARRKSGELPFYTLHENEDMVSRIEEYAEKVRGRFKNLVLIGIGGSALGPIALADALLPLNWNHLSDEERKAPRFFVPDNPDPEYLGAVMEVCPPEDTLYNIVTKSGGTAETMAAYLAVMTPLKEALPEEWREHLVFTTDPSKGNLRKIARNEGITAFSIPSGVGGRFSVMTSVGLLPAALLGINIRDLLAGAAEQSEKVFNREFETNPSAAYAALQYLAHTQRGARMHVMMPYANSLYRVADWFRQLWAESLGKRMNLQGEVVNTGPTPIAALGATDQHSQVQLYVEGPHDKTFTFVVPRNFRRKVHCGKHHSDIESVDYLAGLDVGVLLRAEAEATQRALTAAHRPNMTFVLEEIAPDTIGELLYLLEAATLVAGGLYEVNPLDQPGVEAGKVATYALLGRSGYEDHRAEIEKERQRPSKIVQ